MMLSVTIAAALCAYVACAQAPDASASSTTPAASANGKPNFIVILTDDQDQQMDSLQYMQGVNAHLTEKGTLFPHHYCTVALCCPSRVNMWTGKAAHNTNVTDLQEPYGISSPSKIVIPI